MIFYYYLKRKLYENLIFINFFMTQTDTPLLGKDFCSIRRLRELRYCSSTGFWLCLLHNYKVFCPRMEPKVMYNTIFYIIVYLFMFNTLKSIYSHQPTKTTLVDLLRNGWSCVSQTWETLNLRIFIIIIYFTYHASMNEHEKAKTEKLSYAT